MSRCRLDRYCAIALTIAEHSLPLRYSMTCCQDMRNQRRIFSSGETGRYTEPQIPSDSSSKDWLRATGSVARNPGREYEQWRRRYFFVAPPLRAAATRPAACICPGSFSATNSEGDSSAGDCGSSCSASSGWKSSSSALETWSVWEVAALP